jgi:hypothetical protein
MIQPFRNEKSNGKPKLYAQHTTNGRGLAPQASNTNAGRKRFFKINHIYFILYSILSSSQLIHRCSGGKEERI